MAITKFAQSPPPKQGSDLFNKVMNIAQFLEQKKAREYARDRDSMMDELRFQSSVDELSGFLPNVLTAASTIGGNLGKTGIEEATNYKKQIEALATSEEPYMEKYKKVVQLAGDIKGNQTFSTLSSSIPAWNERMKLLNNPEYTRLNYDVNNKVGIKDREGNITGYSADMLNQEFVKNQDSNYSEFVAKLADPKTDLGMWFTQKTNGEDIYTIANSGTTEGRSQEEWEKLSDDIVKAYKADNPDYVTYLERLGENPDTKIKEDLLATIKLNKTKNTLYSQSVVDKKNPNEGNETTDKTKRDIPTSGIGKLLYTYKEATEIVNNPSKYTLKEFRAAKEVQRIYEENDKGFDDIKKSYEDNKAIVTPDIAKFLDEELSFMGNTKADYKNKSLGEFWLENLTVGPESYIGDFFNDIFKNKEDKMSPAVNALIQKSKEQGHLISKEEAKTAIVKYLDSKEAYDTKTSNLKKQPSAKYDMPAFLPHNTEDQNKIDQTFKQGFKPGDWLLYKNGKLYGEDESIGELKNKFNVSTSTVNEVGLQSISPKGNVLADGYVTVTNKISDDKSEQLVLIPKNKNGLYFDLVTYGSNKLLLNEYNIKTYSTKKDYIYQHLFNTLKTKESKNKKLSEQEENAIFSNVYDILETIPQEEWINYANSENSQVTSDVSPTLYKTLTKYYTK